MSWMTTDEAATHTKMHRQVIARAAASGDLHGYQRTEPRGRWRFRVECLDAWVAGEPCEHQTPTRRLRVS